MSKILVVEDEAFLLQALSDKLKKAGHNVETAVDGVQGMEKIKSFKPELVFLDLLMPNKDGYAVLEEAKSMDETKDIPIVILSNFGDEKEIKKAKDLGARDYYVKANLKLSELVTKIEDYVKK
ncbi:response regulator [Patescibacteria group bacterium]|nr:response regulator [Patescibacteria group bacterium]MBU1890639.1 response regulator [Patescibacteria group bacterium]